MSAIGGISKHEQERMQIYSRILEYEQDAKWLILWREKIKANPEDDRLTLELISEILHTSSHPLAELLVKYQQKIYGKVYPLVMKHIHQLQAIQVPCDKALCNTPGSPDENIKQNITETRSDHENIPVHKGSFFINRLKK